jgi:hypothetical protein
VRNGTRDGGGSFEFGNQGRHLKLGLFRCLRFLEILDGTLERLDQVPGTLR